MKSRKFDYKFLSISLQILLALLSIECVNTYKFVYSFEKNGDSEIFFFVKIVNEKHGIIIVFDLDIWYELRRENHIFTYRNENSIAFEVFNNFLYLKESEDKHENGIIGSDFELAYFLKLTENIAEFSFKLDTYYLKCILILLKCFEVVENRSLLEFLQSLFFYGLVVQKESLSRKDRFDLENAFHSDIFKKLNFSIQKSLCYTFLNMFMITFVFNDGNLIILEKANELYDILLFDKHIPYKNLLKYEKIKIRKLEISPEVYNWIFQKTYIKVIYIENYTPNDEPLTINNFTNNISLTKLVLINVRICLSFVNEIFKLQNLTKLSLESCILESFEVYLPFTLFTKNLISLSLKYTDLVLYKYADIPSQFTSLRHLNISRGNLPPSYISKLSLLCDSSLKVLHCKSYTLDKKDLLRISKLEFYNSLYALNFYSTILCNEDIIFLKKIKNLRFLSLRLYDLDIKILKSCLLSLSVEKLYCDINYIEYIDLKEYLKEKDILAY
ncbi:hypothetical protein CWI37_0210p0020 [Hamiltosporidium tvaerminnensis]|uniref:Uncharacterized protein n=1 Tax=Hamiltosporidium tvaerminnensis TaxID=1176355 RepID=A0A4Q9L879_9MICR|nr:hypothetical protein CWI37_0210p0020 [Hamiltosporidium tvaerminnensis]